MERKTRHLSLSCDVDAFDSERKFATLVRNMLGFNWIDRFPNDLNRHLCHLNCFFNDLFNGGN